MSLAGEKFTSSVLPFQPPNTAASTVVNYQDRISNDQLNQSNLEIVSEWAGEVTGSFETRFGYSGFVGDRLGNVPSGSTTLPFGDASYAQESRVITEVSVVAVGSGSGGVSRWDVRKQFPGMGASPLSIFSNNVFKPILSASAGAFVRTSTQTFVSGGIWNKGELLGVTVEAAAPTMSAVSVIVSWKPSGSYGA